jgi:hypothetical protein
VFFVWRALIGRLVQELGWCFFGYNCEDGFDTGISLRPRITILTRFPAHGPARSLQGASHHTSSSLTSSWGRIRPRGGPPRTQTISCDYGDCDKRDARRGSGEQWSGTEWRKADEAAWARLLREHREPEACSCAYGGTVRVRTFSQPCVFSPLWIPRLIRWLL